MLRRLAPWALLLPALACWAEPLVLPVPLLDHQIVEIGPGQEAVIVAVPGRDDPNLANLRWTGGRLRFENCRLGDTGLAANAPGLPLVVGPGQLLELDGVTVAGADTAVVLRGGEARLQHSVLAVQATALLVDDPASILDIVGGALSRAQTGLEILAAAQVRLEDCLFLTTGTALRSAADAPVILQDCRLQGNEIGLHLLPGAAPLVLSGQVDLLDCRWQQILNQSGTPVDLGDAHLSAPTWIDGPWIRTGTEPATPHRPRKVAAAPAVVISDGDNVDVVVITAHLVGLTNDGIPLKESGWRLFIKINNEPEFHAIGYGEATQPLSYQMTIGTRAVLQARSLIGEWQ
jgi:hypothetical protein